LGRYKKCIYDTTPDFSDLRDHQDAFNKMSEEQLREACLADLLPRGGDRADLILRLLRNSEVEVEAAMLLHPGAAGDSKAQARAGGAGGGVAQGYAVGGSASFDTQSFEYSNGARAHELRAPLVTPALPRTKGGLTAKGNCESPYD
jgi:hypothetical protein